MMLALCAAVVALAVGTTGAGTDPWQRLSGTWVFQPLNEDQQAMKADLGVIELSFDAGTWTLTSRKGAEVESYPVKGVEKGDGRVTLKADGQPETMTIAFLGDARIRVTSSLAAPGEAQEFTKK
jgi:hypothetical protein